MTNLTHDDTAGIDGLDPGTHPARDASHFREIVAARKNVADADLRLRQAVAAARNAGDSWTTIGLALDTSRQAAYQRFGRETSPEQAGHVGEEGLEPPTFRV